jgi:predicted dehydrogenase
MRVGLVGAGQIAPFHLRGWAKLPHARVVGVADPDIARARALAEAHGIAEVFADAAPMLAALALDALDIASPREHHVAHVRIGIAAGLWVLCQKPLAPTLAEAEALAAEPGVATRLMVHENWRFRPPFRRIQAWLASGRIGALRGAVLQVRGSAFFPDSQGRYPGLMRQPFMAALDRLVVSEALIHELDVLRWLLGPLRLRAAWIARTCPAVRGEDRASAAFETEAGAPVLVDADYAVPGGPSRAADELRLVGTAGCIHLDRETLALCTASGEVHEHHPHEAAYQAAFDACIGHFAARIMAGGRFETDLSDNLQTLELVEAIYRAAGPVRVVGAAPVHG